MAKPVRRLLLGAFGFPSMKIPSARREEIERVVGCQIPPATWAQTIDVCDTYNFHMNDISLSPRMNDFKSS